MNSSRPQRQTRLLNCEFIRTMMLEHQLNMQDLARRLAMSSTGVHGILGGANHHVLTLQEASALAGLLGVELSTLLDEEQAGPSAPSQDDVKLEGALVAAEGRKVRYEEVMATFGWTHDRTMRAVRALSSRTSGTAQRVVASSGCCTLRGRREILSNSERQLLAESRLHRSGLDHTDARLLVEAIARDGQSLPTRPNSQRERRRASLLKRGLIYIDEQQRRVHPDVLYSLGLTEVRGRQAVAKDEAHSARPAAGD